MNEVKFIQKIGQVPLSTLVEDAAKQGFVLVGSPTLVSNVPAQLMVYAGVESVNPEYRIVEKTGQFKLSHQITDLMNEGWHVYGSMLSGEVPMQAMVRGDIGVHKLFGMDGSPVGDVSDWAPAIKKARQDAIKEANAYTDEQIKLIPSVTEGADAERVDKLEVRCSDMEASIQDNTLAHQQFESRIDQSMADYIVEVDNKVAFFQQAQVLLTQRVADLEMGLDMEANERRTDVARLEDMMQTLLLEIRTLTQAMPAAAKAGTAWQ